MFPSRWRPPEAPRPSRFTSRGTAAFFSAAAVLFANPATGLAGALALLEPGGRPICTGQPGLRSITTVVPDQKGGYYLLARDDRPDLSVEEGADAFLVHLDPGLTPLPFGDGVGSDSPCGALHLAVLAGAFGRRQGEELYAGIADIDANGLVDGAGGTVTAR